MNDYWFYGYERPGEVNWFCCYGIVFGTSGDINTTESTLTEQESKTKLTLLI